MKRKRMVIIGAKTQKSIASAKINTEKAANELKNKVYDFFKKGGGIMDASTSFALKEEDAIELFNSFHKESRTLTSGYAISSIYLQSAEAQSY